MTFNKMEYIQINEVNDTRFIHMFYHFKLSLFFKTRVKVT